MHKFENEELLRGKAQKAPNLLGTISQSASFGVKVLVSALAKLAILLGALKRKFARIQENDILATETEFGLPLREPQIRRESLHLDIERRNSSRKLEEPHLWLPGGTVPWRNRSVMPTCNVASQLLTPRERCGNA